MHWLPIWLSLVRQNTPIYDRLHEANVLLTDGQQGTIEAWDSSLAGSPRLRKLPGVDGVLTMCALLVPQMGYMPEGRELPSKTLKDIVF